MVEGNLSDNTLSMLEKLVGFDTTSCYSNLKLIEYVQGYLKQYGVDSQLVYNEEGSKANLLATIGPSKPGGVLFSGHTDVVPVAGQAWDSDPFTLTARGSRLYGRGTSDMKGFIAVVLASVPVWVKHQPDFPIHIALSYDEEIGCKGVHSLVDAIVEHGYIQPQLAVIGEPTSMQLVEAHKGIASYITTVKGFEAHSSAVHKGVNAVMVASQLVSELDRMQQQCQAVPPKNANRFDPPYTSVHVGTMQGGTAQNIIPGHCAFSWEYRMVPGQDMEVLHSQFLNHVDTLEKRIKERASTASITTAVRSSVPALASKVDAQVDQELRNYMQQTDWAAVSFGTEAGIFQARDIPSIVCGPGSIMQAHKPNEYIEKEQLQICSEFLYYLTQKFCFQNTTFSV